ncbi:MAG TPA: hypothetical protein VF530_10110 [Planctomycetota bacterium]
MNRLLEIFAMAVGGLSLFTVAFVGFATLSGRDMSQVAVIGKLFPAPAEPGAEPPAATQVDEERRGLSDAAVVEASLGVLSAWTLPSPYSTSELRVLTQEIKQKRGELEERERALARRERATEQDERELEERRRTLEQLRQHIDGLQAELAEREVELARREAGVEAGSQAGWAEVARVLAAVEDPAEAAKKLQEYEPAEAARILRNLGDEARAGEILNAVAPARWKEYVDAYSSAAGTRKPR